MIRVKNNGLSRRRQCHTNKSDIPLSRWCLTKLLATRLLHRPCILMNTNFLDNRAFWCTGRIFFLSFLPVIKQDDSFLLRNETTRNERGLQFFYFHVRMWFTIFFFLFLCFFFSYIIRFNYFVRRCNRAFLGGIKLPVSSLRIFYRRISCFFCVLYTSFFFLWIISRLLRCRFSTWKSVQYLRSSSFAY